MCELFYVYWMMILKMLVIYRYLSDINFVKVFGLIIWMLLLLRNLLEVKNRCYKYVINCIVNVIIIKIS